tara:strand:- start:229 stop:444 length:216 start_codon:yes stop_codon:yes gene_type:complete
MMGNSIPLESAPVLEIGGHALRITAQYIRPQAQKPAAFSANRYTMVKKHAFNARLAGPKPVKSSALEALGS